MFGTKLMMACLGVLLTGVTWSEATTLRVGGSAVILVPPDYVTIQIQVRAEAESAVEANKKTSEIMDKALGVSADYDVAHADIRTTGVMVREHHQNRRQCDAPLIQAEQQLTVTFRYLDKVDEFVDSIVSTGALLSGGTEPGVNDIEVHQKAALEEAIASARAQADVAAAQVGRKVTGTQEINFTSNVPTTRAFAFMSSGSGSRGRYHPGLIPITQSVNAVYSTE